MGVDSRARPGRGWWPSPKRPSRLQANSTKPTRPMAMGSDRDLVVPAHTTRTLWGTPPRPAYAAGYAERPGTFGPRTEPAARRRAASEPRPRSPQVVGIAALGYRDKWGNPVQSAPLPARASPHSHHPPRLAVPVLDQTVVAAPAADGPHVVAERGDCRPWPGSTHHSFRRFRRVLRGRRADPTALVADSLNGQQL